MAFKSRTFVLAGALALSVAGSAAVFAGSFTDEQRGELELMFREYLLKNPEVLRDAFQALEKKTQEADSVAAKAAIVEQAAAIYRSPDDLIAGNAEGKITLVEFFDYNCGYCKRSLPDILKLAEANKDLKIVLKEWPILGTGSIYASKAAIASRAQGKYWDFHLALMRERGVDESKVLEVAQAVGLDVERLKKDMESPDVQAVIQRNTKVAEAIGIQGTPAFLVDEQLFPGAVGYQSLADAVETVRQAGGCKVC